ncbi:hypothetical protein C6558_06000 [Ensifer sp. NM-2]|nr:hypothetical protein C6558_06000 [Ensifer sp. NM-2]
MVMIRTSHLCYSRLFNVERSSAACWAVPTSAYSRCHLKPEITRRPTLVFDLRMKACSNSKCYSDRCASNMTRGAVARRCRRSCK